MKITPSYLLGTAVKITTILNVETPTSVKITIDDPSTIEKVTEVAMTRDAAKVYSYVYQSTATDTEGDYLITIRVVSGAYTGVVQDKFTLFKQE